MKRGKKEENMWKVRIGILSLSQFVHQLLSTLQKSLESLKSKVMERTFMCVQLYRWLLLTTYISYGFISLMFLPFHPTLCHLPRFVFPSQSRIYIWPALILQYPPNHHFTGWQVRSEKCWIIWLRSNWAFWHVIPEGYFRHLNLDRLGASYDSDPLSVF